MAARISRVSAGAGLVSGVWVPLRWCREDPAVCRVGSEGLKQRGRQPIRRGVRGDSPAWTSLRCSSP